MKCLIISLLLSTAVLAVAAPKAEQDVTAAMEAWKQATLKRDATVLNRIYNNDLVYSHSNGRTETKTEAIEAATRGPNTTEAIDILEQNVRIYGKTALVKAKIDIRSNNAGTVQTLHLSALYVWLKTQVGWELVARQSTRLNP